MQCSLLLGFAEQLGLSVNAAQEGWCCSLPTPHPWWNVECDGEHSPRVIDLKGLKLTGVLPTFRNLTSLEELDLRNNMLSGTIPDFDENAALTKIILDINNFSGPVPIFAKNVALIEISLYANNLSGTAPSFSAQSKLEVLDLEKNSLSGTIPDFAENAALASLELASNEFIGTVPSFSSNLQLQMIDLEYNFLSGTVPSFPLHTRLAVLHLYSNKLSGTVPSFSSNERLLQIDFSNNFLTGSPPQVPKSLRRLDVSSNDLSLTSQKLDYSTTPFVNVSYNSFVGSLAHLSLPSPALWDISGNTFVCPYPSIGRGQQVIRDECTPIWEAYKQEIVGSTMATVSLVGLSVFCYCLLVRSRKRTLGSTTAALQRAASSASLVMRSQRMHTIIYMSTLALGVVDVVSDINLNQDMVSFATSRSLDCKEINNPDLFYDILPFRLFSTVDGDYASNFFPPREKVTDLSTYVELLESVLKHHAAVNNVAFINKTCHLQGCVFTSGLECKRISGTGQELSTFLLFVHIVLAVMLCKEAVKVACISFFCCRGSGVPWQLRGFCRTSIFSPLLLLGAFRKCRPPPRKLQIKEITLFSLNDAKVKDSSLPPTVESFTTSIVCYKVRSFGEWWAILFYEGAMENFPQLVLSIYYVFYVLDQGLSLLNLVSIGVTVGMSSYLVFQGIKEIRSWSSPFTRATRYPQNQTTTEILLDDLNLKLARVQSESFKRILAQSQSSSRSNFLLYEPPSL